MRVLFNFVNLQPNEILELGKDYAAEKKKNGYNPTEKEIEKADIVDGFAVLASHIISEANR